MNVQRAKKPFQASSRSATATVACIKKHGGNIKVKARGKGGSISEYSTIKNERESVVSPACPHKDKRPVLDEWARIAGYRSDRDGSSNDNQHSNI